jgi:hypothetical protein
LPFQLARRQPPGSVRVLDYSSFYWPPWSDWGLAQLYRTGRCLLPGSSAVHLWETKMWRSLLGHLAPHDVERGASCFARSMAAVLGGSYDFSSARLEPGELAEEEIVSVSSRPLSVVALGGDDLPCDDAEAQCPAWAERGECESNPRFMSKQCRKSCRLCEPAQRGWFG